MDNNLRESIDRVFEFNSDLINVGTKQDYLLYIKSRLHNTEVKSILFHGSTEDRWMKYNPKVGEYTLIIDKFNTDEGGVHFGTYDAATQRIDINRYNADSYLMEMSDNIYIPVIIESNNVISCKDQGDSWYTLEEEFKKVNVDVIAYSNIKEDRGKVSYNVIGKDVIHILGSDKDIISFKNFKDRNKHQYHNIEKEILKSTENNKNKNFGMSI